jgi:uncharacterized protein (DUF58 family)
VNAIRRGWRAWWQTRHPRTDTWTLTQGNIYIVPTRAGFMFALTLLVMLLASINYQMNLGFVLTFLLAGSGLSSMYITHRTLRGVALHLRPPQPVFAGEPALLEIVLNSAGRRSHGIGLKLDLDELNDEAAEQDAPWVWVDVPAQGQAPAHLSLVPPRRGLHPVPTVRVETRYPFGLFRAWTLWRPASPVLAYPAPERPTPPLPAAHASGGDGTPQRASQGGEFDGVRAYQRGDTLKRIVWKKAAHTGELVSRDMQAATQRELWLDYQGVPLPDTERRLSRLASWVIAADRAGIAHGLRLPGNELPIGLGEPHRRAALEALALWQ